MTRGDRVEPDNEFARLLRDVLPAPCRDRPFVCDGLPQSCDVMLVGENPATDLGGDWWDLWSDTDGCDKIAADEAYLAGRRARLERKRALGQMRARFISPTHDRTALFDLRLRAGNSRLVVTNVHRNGHQDGAGPEAISNLAVLRLLLVHMRRLKVVVVQGTKASKVLRGLDFPPTTVKIPSRHFSRSSGLAIQQLADEVLKIIAVSEVDQC